MKAGEKSRQAFLNAAGKLFAEKGIANVCLRDVAHEAGVDASMIHYHFGGKDGLIQAVIDQELQRWHEDDISKYYQQNKHLLENRAEQIIFVNGLVDCVYKNLGGTRVSGNSLLLQILQYPHPLRQVIIDKHIIPGVEIFREIYAKITGEEDFDSAFCCYLLLICPEYMYSACPGMIELFYPGRNISSNFERRLQHFTTRMLLNGMGLLGRN